MSRFKYPNLVSRYGLPKNRVHTDVPLGTPRGAVPWLAARDDFDALLYDTLDALHAGVIDRKTFDREKARLTIARRSADARFEHAVRQGLRPPSAYRMKRPR